MDGTRSLPVPAIPRAQTSQQPPTEQTVGIDCGGTFTDFVFIAPDGRISVWKRLSTPDDPSQSILAGLREARGAGLLTGTYEVSHGTTVATNALLQRKGAKTALITTRGFRDVLEIGRQTRSHLYSLHPGRTAPLLPRELRYEATERVDWLGQVLTPLDEAGALDTLQHLFHSGVESLAICFLFSYLNPIHEQRVADIARRFGFAVSISSEIAPEPREYERTSTTVANAFVAPILSGYLSRLNEQAQEEGVSRLRIMQSSGGALSAEEASAQAIKTALSGPAGGVIASAQIGAEAGFSNLLTFDMGGTSTDVALITGGFCPVVTTASLGGLPLRTPMMDIHTIGAGGGSLARLDAAGGLRVGPESAGAVPGPVAYGVGETLTVTDANVLLGRIPARLPLGDQIVPDTARVRRYFERFSKQTGRSPEETALGIVRIAETAMARALRTVSVERGVDPVNYALMSFGGAGGLHACALADALGVRRILIPRFPGAFSALGLALAPVQRELARAFPARRLNEDGAAAVWEELGALVVEMEAAALRQLAREGANLQSPQIRFSLDMRYAGQSFEIRVPFDKERLPQTRADFHVLHRQRYGHADVTQTIETLALRCIASGTRKRPPLHTPVPTQAGEPADTLRLFEEERWCTARMYRREALSAGQTVEGPSIIVQSDATTYLASNWQCTTDIAGNMLLNIIA